MSDDPETIDTAGDMVIAAVSEKLWPLALGALGMAALSFLLAWPILPDMNAFERIVGWVGVIFFGGGSILVVLHSLGLRRDVLTLTPQGFFGTRVSSTPVPWSAVIGVRPLSIAGTQLIVVKVADEIWRSGTLKPMVRWTRAANRWLGMDGIVIPVMGMPVRSRELVKILRRYARAHRKSNITPENEETGT